jgi:hypothetical protein
VVFVGKNAAVSLFKATLPYKLRVSWPKTPELSTSGLNASFSGVLEAVPITHGEGSFLGGVFVM